MKVLTVIGARPQFIKASAVSACLRARHQEVLLHTGQHYDEAMSAQFFRELEIPPPDIELGVGSGSHAEQTAKMMIGIERAIAAERPDVMLLYGDTNSTLAGALTAAKAQVPIAHVEAGLRSFNRAMPEEINRVLTDAVSSWLFCPSDTAAEQLAREGITQGVHVVGDVMADVLATFGSCDNGSGALSRHGLSQGDYFLATIHRADNTDNAHKLRAIVEALSGLSLPVMVPVHPRLRAAMSAARVPAVSNIRLIDPVGYIEMMALARHARAVLTDSGGLQKEAYWLGVPCVTLRDETEWVETVATGWNTLVGVDRARITAAAHAAAKPAARPPLYGDGHAAARIVEALNTWK